MPETAEPIRKLRLTLVNGVPRMVPQESGSAVLYFVPRVMLCSALLSPASLLHDLASFQVRDAHFPFLTTGSAKAGNQWLPEASPVPRPLPEHGSYCSRTWTFMELPLWLAWARGLGHRHGKGKGREGKAPCRPHPFHPGPCEKRS